MKRAAPLICGCGLLLISGFAHAADGTVTSASGSECSDYFVVSTDDGYALLEWYGGPMTEEDDKVTGEFDRFAAEDISVLPSGNRMRVYVEDYGLSKDDAADKLKEKCN